MMLAPQLGGTERRIGNFTNNFVEAGLPVEGLCWTRDSKALIVAASESPGKPNRLELVPLDGGEPKILTHPARLCWAIPIPRYPMMDILSPFYESSPTPPRPW